ncbi:MAG: phosphotransferase family protein [Sporichthyaceae bacterium]
MNERAALAAGIADLLADALPGATNLRVDDVDRVFGGNARLAWSATASWIDPAGAHREPLILLVRGSGSQVRTDPELEIRHLRGLAENGVRAPRVWAADPAGRRFDGPAVLLSRLPGAGDAVAFLRADEATGRARTLDLALAAAQLHAVSRGPAEADEVPQLEQWGEQIRRTRLEPLPALDWLLGWLREHQQPPARTVVVHGDFRVGNVLYEGERITAVLDWEMAHIGDPIEDLAWAYRALWSPARFVSLAEFCSAYTAAGGAQVSEFSLRWHRVFSEVKFAAISLAAARSFVDGTSTNLRLIDRARTVVPAIELCLSWVRAGDRAVSPC